MGVFDFLKKEKPDQQMMGGLPPPQIPASNDLGIPQPPLDESPLFPELPVSEEINDEPLSMPEVPSIEENAPDKIPALEDLPEAPTFSQEEEKIKRPRLEEEPFQAQARTQRFEPIVARREEVVMSHKIKGPLFAKLDDYREVLGDVETIKNNLKNTDNNFIKLNDYRSEQDKLFEHLNEEFEDMQRKLVYVDKILFER